MVGLQVDGNGDVWCTQTHVQQQQQSKRGAAGLVAASSEGKGLIRGLLAAETWTPRCETLGLRVRCCGGHIRK